MFNTPKPEDCRFIFIFHLSNSENVSPSIWVQRPHQPIICVHNDFRSVSFVKIEIDIWWSLFLCIYTPFFWWDCKIQLYIWDDSYHMNRFEILEYDRYILGVHRIMSKAIQVFRFSLSFFYLTNRKKIKRIAVNRWSKVTQ